MASCSCEGNSELCNQGVCVVPCRTQGVSESFAKASQVAKDATGQLKEQTSKVSSILSSCEWLALRSGQAHDVKTTPFALDLQTAASMQDQVRSAAEAYTKPAEQPTQQSTTEQAQSPASASALNSPNSAAATSSQQQEQQQQHPSQSTSASSKRDGTEAQPQDESKARHGHTSTSNNSNQQSGGGHKAKDARSEGKPEGLMYRLRSIRDAVRKEVCVCENQTLSSYQLLPAHPGHPAVQCMFARAQLPGSCSFDIGGHWVSDKIDCGCSKLVQSLFEQQLTIVIALNTRVSPCKSYAPALDVQTADATT